MITKTVRKCFGRHRADAMSPMGVTEDLRTLEPIPSMSRFEPVPEISRSPEPFERERWQSVRLYADQESAEIVGTNSGQQLLYIHSEFVQKHAFDGEKRLSWKYLDNFGLMHRKIFTDRKQYERKVLQRQMEDVLNEEDGKLPIQVVDEFDGLHKKISTQMKESTEIFKAKKFVFCERERNVEEECATHVGVSAMVNMWEQKQKLSSKS